MSTIQGPKLQFSVSEFFDFQYDADGKIVGASLKQQAAALLNALQQTAFAVTRSGPTASRPTSSFAIRWIGMPYFDTTVGGPVFLSSTNPDVWVSVAGAGTVQSVNVSSYGIQSFTGGPITASGTIAGLWSGNSGGIPYFSSAAFLSSTAVLASSGVMVGGGAGNPPHTVTALTSGQLLFGTAGDPSPKTVSGDVQASSSGALTVSSVAGLTVQGAFTAASTATFNNAITPSQTFGIVGTTTNNNANAGSVGEYLSTQVLSNLSIPVSTGTAANVTSMTLTAGDWDVWGSVGLTNAPSTVVTNFGAWTSTTSATLPTAPNNGSEMFYNLTFAAGSSSIIPAGQQRVTVSTATVVYLSGFVSFGTSTSSIYGFLGARRRR